MVIHWITITGPILTQVAACLHPPAIFDEANGRTAQWASGRQDGRRTDWTNFDSSRTMSSSANDFRRSEWPSDPGQTGSISSQEAWIFQLLKRCQYITSRTTLPSIRQPIEPHTVQRTVRWPLWTNTPCGAHTPCGARCAVSRTPCAAR